MGIEATSSTSVSSTSAAQTAGASNSDSAKKTSSDSSFKDEMDKVSSSENKKDNKDVDKADDKVNPISEKEDKKSADASVDKDAKKSEDTTDTVDTLLTGTVDYSKFGSMALQDANLMLSNDIRQMINNTTVNNVTGAAAKTAGLFSFGNTDGTQNSISLTQSDAQFFINLTQNNDISTQNVVAQAQTMLNTGADVAEVKQNVQISQALLNAINNAKETNQPLRIDFDQNVSVILRIGKDGAIAANFIPGDKAVEQYLRNNIESLKATFNNNDLPYTELSYSNSSKQQNQRRRQNQQQQGE